MSYIYLGDLTVEQIERDYGFGFTDEERGFLRETRHHAAHFEDGDAGWHMFDLPPTLALSDGPVGRKVLGIFMRHSDEMNGSFPACFAGKEGQ